MITEMGQKMPEIQRELGSRGQTEGRRIAEQSNLKENLSNDAIKRKIYKKLENSFSEPFKHMGANISNAVSSYVDNFMDSLIDRHSVNISKEVSSLASGALGGSSGARAKMGTMIKEAGSSTFASGATKVGTGERMLEMLTDQRSDKMNRYDMLEGLKGKGLASERQGIVKGLFGSSQESLGLTQSAQQIAGTKKYLGDLQNYGSKEFGSKIAKDDAFALDTFNVSKGIGEVLRKHGAEMKNMSQMERIQFIKGKIGESKGLLNTNDLALKRLTGKGASIEELISHAQRQEGMTDYIGAVNFNKLSGEMYNTGEFGSAGQLSAANANATW
jgi:hypothetical protein